jgi:Lipid A 3-O-deacylase (PagL)
MSKYSPLSQNAIFPVGLLYAYMTSRNQTVLILLISIFSLFCCRAQDNSGAAGFGINANFFVGKVLKHTEKFELPIPALSSGADINFQWNTYGRKEWQQRRRYPTVGVAIGYINYGQDSIYGRAVSIYPNITFPIIRGRRVDWTFRIGDGVGFITREYSRLKHFDTINNAIGSKINDFGSFMTDVNVHINKHWDVQLGANFSHISDASFHQPNLGINVFGGHIGVKYYPVTSRPTLIHRDLKPLKNRWMVDFRLTMAFDESYAPLGPLYPIYLGTGYVSKRWISKNKAFAGLDYSYHTNIYAILKNNVGFVPEGSEKMRSWKSGVFVGNEFLLGRVGVVCQLGYYIHQAYLTQGIIYEKLGGNLYLVQKEHGPIKEFFLCAFLKTHFSVAELAEFGFGMGF